MGVREEGSNIVVDSSISGSLFPKSEKDIIFPVMIDGSAVQDTLVIEGSVYGRSLEVRGNVLIWGPVVSRGDTKITPTVNMRVQLMGGITVNGVFNAGFPEGSSHKTLHDAIESCSVVIRGDVAVNQSVFLNNAIVFGSITAVNCRLLNCVVLGTVTVQEKLTVAMSSIGGYRSREVVFEGACTMIHAIGESNEKPVFSPYELIGGEVIASDIRYYPAMRNNSRLTNITESQSAYPSYSALDAYADWVQVLESTNEVVDAVSEKDRITKWVLSIGGRVGDFHKIKKSIDALTDMLKCGFEFDHIVPEYKFKLKEKVLTSLNQDEAWILNQVCRS
jgi:hypothetical protein